MCLPLDGPILRLETSVWPRLGRESPVGAIADGVNHRPGDPEQPVAGRRAAAATPSPPVACGRPQLPVTLAHAAFSFPDEVAPQSLLSRRVWFTEDQFFRSNVFCISHSLRTGGSPAVYRYRACPRLCRRRQGRRWRRHRACCVVLPLLRRLRVCAACTF